jgi:hypothetical protein
MLKLGKGRREKVLHVRVADILLQGIRELMKKNHTPDSISLPRV